MERRGKISLRMQQTVEGLSVAAITYYAAGLLGYLAKPLKSLWPAITRTGSSPRRSVARLRRLARRAPAASRTAARLTGSRRDPRACRRLLRSAPDLRQSVARRGRRRPRLRILAPGSNGKEGETMQEGNFAAARRALLLAGAAAPLGVALAGNEDTATIALFAPPAIASRAPARWSRSRASSPASTA